MNNLDKKLQMSGFIAFFLSGICSISSGIVVSLLQERYGFDYNVTGTLLSIMSIGNLMAGFATGVLPAKIGLKATIITLSAGYELGLSVVRYFRLDEYSGAFFSPDRFCKRKCHQYVYHPGKQSLKEPHQRHEYHAFLLCPGRSPLSFYHRRRRTYWPGHPNAFFKLFRTCHVDHFPTDTY